MLENVVGGATYHWGLKEGAWTIHPDFWDYLQKHAQKMFDKGKYEFKSPFPVYFVNQEFRIVLTSKYPLGRDVLVPRIEGGILRRV